MMEFNQNIVVADMKLSVDYRYNPGLPMLQPSLSGPGEPAEAPEIDLGMIWLVDGLGQQAEFSPEGLHIKEHGKIVSLDDAIKNAVLEGHDE